MSCRCWEAVRLAMAQQRIRDKVRGMQLSLRRLLRNLAAVWTISMTTSRSESLAIRGFRYYVDPVTGRGEWRRPHRCDDEDALLVDMTVMQAEQYVLEVEA